MFLIPSKDLKTNQTAIVITVSLIKETQFIIMKNPLAKRNCLKN
jgi:hypothetical protein